MRAKEVSVHAVDLGAGARFDDLPADLVTALLVDVVTKRANGGEGPALAAWLTGRADEAPALGRWL
jgi:maleylpyruvate isomerase